MTRYVAKLAGNAGPWTRSVVHGANDDLSVPIKDILDAAKTPARFLPWLAAGRAVRLWWEDWGDDRKRAIVADWTRLARLIGTRAAAEAFLPYVDSELIDKVSHPTRFVLGRSPIGLTPIGHQAFTTHFLVHVPLMRPAHAFVIGRSAFGQAALRPVDDEPTRRVEVALTVSKSPDTAYFVNFGHREQVRIEDEIDLDDELPLDGFIERKRL